MKLLHCCAVTRIKLVTLFYHVQTTEHYIVRETKKEHF